MKTKKQAAVDRLNRTAMDWPSHLRKHFQRLGQAAYTEDRAAQALVNLDSAKLTVAQLDAIRVLIGAAASAAFSAGVELGKSFETKKKGN